VATGRIAYAAKFPSRRGRISIRMQQNWVRNGYSQRLPAVGMTLYFESASAESAAAFAAVSSSSSHSFGHFGHIFHVSFSKFAPLSAPEVSEPV
jgi:hypothetical protein